MDWIKGFRGVVHLLRALVGVSSVLFAVGVSLNGTGTNYAFALTCTIAGSLGITLLPLLGRQAEFQVAAGRTDELIMRLAHLEEHLPRHSARCDPFVSPERFDP